MKRMTAYVLVMLLVVALLAFCAGYALGEANRSGTAELTLQRTASAAESTGTLPSESTTPGSSASPEQTASPARTGGLLDLNTAGKEELMELPGIGEVLAERILAYREENGGFSAVEDLLEVEGIGEKRLDAIRDLITVEETYENTGS